MSRNGAPAGLDEDAAAGLLRGVRDRLALSGSPANAAGIAPLVAGLAEARGTARAERLVRWLCDELGGLGPLQTLADGPGVSDVLVLADGSVWVDGAQGGLRRASLRFDSAEEVRDLAVRIVAAGGRRLDDAQPCADVALGRFRVHAVLPPVAVGGPVLSVRVLHRAGGDLATLLGEANPWLDVLRRVVGLRLNWLVSGGTGAGKTTLLAAMLSSCAAHERLVVAEDAHELQPRHPHVVSLQSRHANADGAGGLGLAELVRQALRMRPDRLIVGECRGEEIREVLMAMNTGHHGAGATVHANGAEAISARLLALGALAGWDSRTTSLHAASALDVVVHVERRGVQRLPVSLSRIVLGADERLRLDAVLLDDGDGAPRRGPAWAWFAALGERA